VCCDPAELATRVRLTRMDCAPSLAPGTTGSLSGRGARYGWFDQAHFTREFTGLVGASPGAYRDQLTTSGGPDASTR